MKRKILLSSRAYKVMTNEVDYSEKDETGGILLGYILGKRIFVVEAVDGGPQRAASKSSFCFDYDYVQYVSTKISNLYDPPLILVGVWHKHNSYHENPFSEDDESMHKEVCSLVDNDITSIIFQFTENEKYIMNTYWVDTSCRVEKVDFTFVKNGNILGKIFHRE